jgi:hypothetical protein
VGLRVFRRFLDERASGDGDKKVFDKSKFVGEMDKRRSERLPDFICKKRDGKKDKSRFVVLCFVVLVGVNCVFACAAVFKSEFWGLVFAKFAFCGFADFTGITSARHCQSNALSLRYF